MASTADVQVFGGVLSPGIYEVALYRTLAAYRLYPAALTDKVWQRERTIATARPDVPAGKRIWYRNSKDLHGISGFICIDPGEFRTIEPTGPGDLVLDQPQAEGAALSSVLWQTLKASQAESVAQSAALKRYQEIAYRVLDADSRTYDPGTEPVPEGVQFFESAHALGCLLYTSNKNGDIC